VTRVAISDLKPDPNNPRVHSEHQLKQLAKSIKAFGFVQPVLIDGMRRVVAGHGRIEAAKLLGLHKVPTISILHLSEPQLRALVIADNRLAERASWNKKLLGEQLEFLSQVELDFDLEAIGFEVGEIDLLIEGLSPARAGVHEPADESPAPSVSVIVTRQGDLWLADSHRMYCGNALERSSFSSLMEGQKAAAVFIDPPSNVKIDGPVGGRGRSKHREFAMASGEMSELSL
jgi:ParB-like chromosome segregation protein Spo0J